MDHLPSLNHPEKKYFDHNKTVTDEVSIHLPQEDESERGVSRILIAVSPICLCVEQKPRNPLSYPNRPRLQSA